jgi:hypothetical protein
MLIVTFISLMYLILALLLLNLVQGGRGWSSPTLIGSRGFFSNSYTSNEVDVYGSKHDTDGGDITDAKGGLFEMLKSKKTSTEEPLTSPLLTPPSGNSYVNVPHLVVAGELTINSSQHRSRATLARMDLTTLQWSPKHPTLYLYSSSHNQDTGTVYALMSNHTKRGEGEKGGEKDREKGGKKDKGRKQGGTRGGENCIDKGYIMTRVALFSTTLVRMALTRVTL